MKNIEAAHIRTDNNDYEATKKAIVAGSETLMHELSALGSVVCRDLVTRTFRANNKEVIESSSAEIIFPAQGDLMLDDDDLEEVSGAFSYVRHRRRQTFYANDSAAAARVRVAYAVDDDDLRVTALVTDEKPDLDSELPPAAQAAVDAFIAILPRPSHKLTKQI